MTKRPATKALRTVSLADLTTAKGGTTKGEKLEYLKIELKDIIVTSVGG